MLNPHRRATQETWHWDVMQHAARAMPRTVTPASPLRGGGLHRLVMKEGVDFARGLRADAGDLGKVGGCCAFDRLERSEVMQQRALAARSHPGNFLQARFANIAAAPDAVRADREAVCLIAQALNEIKHGIARLELESFPSRHKERFEAGITL